MSIRMLTLATVALLAGGMLGGAGIAVAATATGDILAVQPAGPGVSNRGRSDVRVAHDYDFCRHGRVYKNPKTGRLVCR